MHLTAYSILVCVGSAAILGGCTPVNDYRIDHQKRAEMEAGGNGASGKGASMRTISKRDSGTAREPSSTASGSAGASGKRAAADSKSDNAQESQTEDVKMDAGLDASTDAADPKVIPNTTDEAAMQLPASTAQQQAGWAALTQWAALPTFSSSTTQLFSTHERGEEPFPLVDPGNKDFNGFLAVCGEHPTLIGQQNDASVACATGETGYLVAADDGPGYVSRILLARGISSPSSAVLVELRPVNERIRIYIDGDSKPVFDGLWTELADAKVAPFNTPLMGWTSGGTISYLPISYSKRLRVFVDDLTDGSLTLYYIHVNTHRVEATQPYAANALASPEARAELDALLAKPSSAGTTWFDQDVTLDGSGAWTVWSRETAGTLQRIELQLDASSANEILNETSLRMSWDGGAAAIDLPLGAMFASRHGIKPVATLPLSVQLDGSSARLSLSLPMPFASGAKLELLHAAQSTRTIRVRLSGTDATPKGEWGRLHSAFAELRDPKSGERFRLAALSGRGKYVGSMLYVHGKADNTGQVRASELGFLEGDERLEVDGQATWLGTGTDNYFNGGFYFKDGLFNSPFAAVSQLDANESTGMSEATLLRWTILSEDVNFQKQLDLSFELGANRPATVRDCAAVSFYYQ